MPARDLLLLPIELDVHLIAHHQRRDASILISKCPLRTVDLVQSLCRKLTLLTAHLRERIIACGRREPCTGSLGTCLQRPHNLQSVHAAHGLTGKHLLGMA